MNQRVIYDHVTPFHWDSDAEVDAILDLQRSTAQTAIQQAAERDEAERIEAMIAFYDSMDELALNDYFLSKGEWV